MSWRLPRNIFHKNIGIHLLFKTAEKARLRSFNRRQGFLLRTIRKSDEVFPLIINLSSKFVQQIVSSSSVLFQCPTINSAFRKPDKTEEDEPQDPCPYCGNEVPQTKLDCPECKNTIPYCIITVSNNWIAEARGPNNRQRLGSNISWFASFTCKNVSLVY